MRAARRGELVVPRAPIVLRHAPIRLQQSFLLEAVHGLVQRRVFDVERSAGGLLEPGDDLEAVHRGPGQRAKYEEVEGAFEDGQLAHLRYSMESLYGRCVSDFVCAMGKFVVGHSRVVITSAA